MAAAVSTIPLMIEKGATVRRKITLKDPTGAAIDMTGCSASLHIRFGTIDLPGDIALQVATPATRAAITDAINGIITMTIPSTDTATMVEGDYIQECWVTYSDSSTERVFVRYVQVRPTGIAP